MMKNKVLHLSQVLHSPHYCVVKAPFNSNSHFCPHLHSTERPLASFYRCCWLSIRKNIDTSTDWWCVHPSRCRAEIPRGRCWGGSVLHNTSMSPLWCAQARKLCFGASHCKPKHRTPDLCLAHLQPLLAPALCCSAHPTLTGRWRSNAAACALGNSPQSSGDAWGRTEMHRVSPSHPRQYLSFPLSLKHHHSWQLHSIYLLFKRFKQTSQPHLKFQQMYIYPNWNLTSVPEYPDLCMEKKC